MGINASKCVHLHDAADLIEAAYTVVRTDGNAQAGWVIDREAHSCPAAAGHIWLPGAHAILEATGWRVHMHNGLPAKGPDAPALAHSCGWRRLGTFWPTSLTGDESAIDAWTAGMKATIERLATEQGLPIEWAEHTCAKGPLVGARAAARAAVGSTQEPCRACVLDEAAKAAKAATKGAAGAAAEPEEPYLEYRHPECAMHEGMYHVATGAHALGRSTTSGGIQPTCTCEGSHAGGAI
jgi:hypothetical protein